MNKVFYKIMNLLMLSCRKATELMEKKTVMKLSVVEKVQLRMHTRMCDACNTYQKQSQLIDQVLHYHLTAGDESKVPLIKNPPLKKKIISKIK